MKTLIQLTTYVLLAACLALYLWPPDPMPQFELFNPIAGFLIGRAFRAAFTAFIIAILYGFGVWTGWREKPEYDKPFDPDLNRLMLVAAFLGATISMAIYKSHRLPPPGLADIPLLPMLVGGILGIAALAAAVIAGANRGRYERQLRARQQPDSNLAA